MLALIVVACVAGVTTLGKNTNSTFAFVADNAAKPVMGYPTP